MNKARTLKEVFAGVKPPKRNRFFDELVSMHPIVPIHTQKQYDTARIILNNTITLTSVMKDSAEKEGMQMYGEAVAVMIQGYEEKRFPVSKISGREMLGFLMDQHGLKQTDLAKELGGQPVVSAILKGDRELNVRQIKALAKRFNVPVGVFIGEAA